MKTILKYLAYYFGLLAYMVVFHYDPILPIWWYIICPAVAHILVELSEYLQSDEFKAWIKKID